MVELLKENPLLLLFIVASLGYLVGNLKFRGSSLGVAAVLFVGLAFGAIDKDLHIPDVIFSLGLVLFVYSIGLSSGAAFFKSYKKNGLRDFFFLLTMLILSGLIAIGLAFLFGLDAASITGVYAGSTTNTPALAGVIDYVQGMNANGLNDELTKKLVVGYSYSYPMGVLGGIIAIVLMEKLLKINYKEEAYSLRKEYPLGDNLSSYTIEVSKDNPDGKQLRDLYKEHKWNVVFGRIDKQGDISLSNYDIVLEKGDLIVVVGEKEELERVTEILGKKAKKSLSYYRHKYDSRRIFVSRPEMVGKTIASLGLDKKYNALITRIRRGDVDMLAKDDMVLEMGDRIRFVARRKDLKALSNYFGDSYTQSSKVNLFSFGLGIGLGLILGSFEIPIAENFSFKLGNAGGPLIVGLVLGALRRTGPVVWLLPYSSNVTLQQIGLILLLSCVGITSGNSFVESFTSEGILFFAASCIISILSAVLTLLIGYKLIKIPFSLLMGIVSNQPAILDFATSRSGTQIPMYGYTMMFPIALISKIVIAQILFVLLFTQ